MQDDARRARFLAYFRAKFDSDRKKFMRATGFTKGRVSQLFSHEQPFGERAGVSVAQRLGLRDDFFDHDPPNEGHPTAEALQVAREYDLLSDDEKIRFKLLLQAARTAVHSATPPPASPLDQQPAASSQQPAAGRSAGRKDSITRAAWASNKAARAEIKTTWDLWESEHGRAPPERDGSDH